tara:strand:+ start:939 stop:3053 length:2115 start_codon:yes stop_codon:yes gene_type:complete
MGALEIYLKIFMQKLWNILWPLFENKKMSKKIVIDQQGDEIEKLLSPQAGVEQEEQKTYGITRVPDGYSLKHQGMDMCDGEPMESGGPYSVLDEFDDRQPVKYIGDDPFLLMLDRAGRKCDATDECKFISFWMDGSYSMYNSQNCSNPKEALNTSVTLENLHQYSNRRAVVNEDTGDVELDEPAPTPPPPPPPPPLPTIDSREKCDNHINNTLKPYDSNKTYPGLSLSNKNNYCTSMVVRPGIARACQERACRFTSGTKAGGIKEGLPPGWQEVSSGMQYDANYGIHEDVYYWNTNTNETTWQKPRNISDGKDFFEMKEFCPGACLTLIGNELPKSQSRSGHMNDAIGEILQIPGHTSGNPWMPENNIFNQLPEITEDDCLAINEVKAGRQRVIDNRVGVGVWEDIPAWKPTKSQMFNMKNSRFYTEPGFYNPNSEPEEPCAENPDLPGYGVIRNKSFIGLTDDKKACRVQFNATSSSCNRDCKLRFFKTEARHSGYENKYKTRITSWEELFKKSGGNLSDPEMKRASAGLIETDLRKTWEIGRKVGVRWGIDERPGVGHINEDVQGHYITYGDLDAPYGYKIWAEFISVDAPKLGSGKCPIQETGWYRTAKVPITQDEVGYSKDYSNLKANYNYGEKMKLRLANENQPDQVVIVESPEQGYVTEVYSKTPNYARGNRNWNWNGPITHDTSDVDADYSLEEVLG